MTGAVKTREDRSAATRVGQRWPRASSPPNMGELVAATSILSKHGRSSSECGRAGSGNRRPLL
jgi:hypothetical protein